MPEAIGEYGTTYDIDPAQPLESIDAHLAALRKNNLMFHPDFDLLLDARWNAVESRSHDSEKGN